LPKLRAKPYLAEGAWRSNVLASLDFPTGVVSELFFVWSAHPGNHPSANMLFTVRRTPSKLTFWAARYSYFSYPVLCGSAWYAAVEFAFISERRASFPALRKREGTSEEGINRIDRFNAGQ
jgi:hypothetical protein